MTTYHHILVPTDGSAQALAGVRQAIALAQDLKAKLTGLYVMPPFQASCPEAAMYGRTTDDSRRIHEEMSRVEAKEVLGQVETLAKAAQVDCESLARNEMPPWQAIIDTAASEDCDLIVMGSRGRGNLAAALLGSQARQVLAHSKTPVLVCR